MEINNIMKEIYQNNVKKGFWEEKRNVGEMLMLIVSELAEALEADRKDRRADLPSYFKYISGTFKYEGEELEAFQKYVKDTFEDELADTCIRVFDICEGLGIDLETHIRLKLNYNKTRPYKHNKNY